MNIHVTSRLADTGSEMARSRVAQAGAATQGSGVQMKASETAMSEVTASLVYRPQQNEVPPDNTYGSFEVWTAPIPRGFNHELRTSAASKLDVTTDALKGKYSEFKKSLQAVAPDLARLDFGFTVDPQGDLVATGVGGEQKGRLTQFLNQNEALKALATQYVSDVMAYAKADGDFGLGRFKLDLSNFQNTVDIGEAMDARGGNPQKSVMFWQVVDNGVVDMERRQQLQPVRIK